MGFAHYGDNPFLRPEQKNQREDRRDSNPQLYPWITVNPRPAAGSSPAGQKRRRFFCSTREPGPRKHSGKDRNGLIFQITHSSGPSQQTTGEIDRPRSGNLLGHSETLCLLSYDLHIQRRGSDLNRRTSFARVRVSSAVLSTTQPPLQRRSRPGSNRQTSAFAGRHSIPIELQEQKTRPPAGVEPASSCNIPLPQKAGPQQGPRRAWSDSNAQPRGLEPRTRPVEISDPSTARLLRLERRSRPGVKARRVFHSARGAIRRRELGSDRCPRDFQSRALPAELSRRYPRYTWLASIQQTACL